MDVGDNLDRRARRSRLDYFEHSWAFDTRTARVLLVLLDEDRTLSVYDRQEVELQHP